MRNFPETQSPIVPQVGRRAFLSRTGALFGAAASLPLIGCDDPSAPDVDPEPLGDPDVLFSSGRFEAADLAYQAMLEANPDYAHALAQRGYIALMSNRFEDAETFLTQAIELAPDDDDSKWRLADTFVRQDDFARAVPLIRETARGQVADQREAIAAQYEALASTGQPYELNGPEVARVPWRLLDPLTVIEISVNGSEPIPLNLDTGAPGIGLTRERADRVGLREIASYQGMGGSGTGGGISTISLGIANSVQLGELELRNVPVSVVPAFPPLEDGTQLGGAIGTVILYHFLSTLDYANTELVLRRKTDEQLQAFLAEAESMGDVESTDFWMVPTHFLYGRGRLNGHDMICTLDTGGGEGAGVTTSEHTALRVGAEIDYDDPSSGGQRTTYPIVVQDVALGPVTRQSITAASAASRTATAGTAHPRDRRSRRVHRHRYGRRRQRTQAQPSGGRRPGLGCRGGRAA